jgi:hypothetical protein
MTDISKMYSSVGPINSAAHGDVSIRPATGLEFIREINSVPILAAEFPAAAVDMTIVFAGESDTMIPVALLGVKEGENLYLNDDAKWKGRYVPAFIRRYPFIFARGDEDTMTLCIDESYDGFNRAGRGERLFDIDGNRTQYLDNMLTFVTQYQRQHVVTQAFCARLEALDLLEPATLSASDANGEQRRLAGFKVINRQKFKQIKDEDLLTMFRRDELELCYSHMHSLQNLGLQLRNSMADATQEEAAAPIQ